MSEVEALVQGGAVGLALSVIIILGWVLRRMMDRDDKLLIAYQRNNEAFSDLRTVLQKHASAVDRTRESIDRLERAVESCPHNAPSGGKGR